MENIYALIRKYPHRIKYGLLVACIFAMILAVRTYVNYISIESAIEHAIVQKQIKTDELHYTQHFLIPYEQSPYASYFLQHENNMLLRDEYIIKFEEMYQKPEIPTGSTTIPLGYEDTTIKTPQESWKRFIGDKLQRK